MDCQEIKEILDAYALGALEGKEVHAVEEHVADCLRCWDELTEAQRTAAALALGVPVRQAGANLRQRILAAARRSQGRVPRGDIAAGLRQRRLLSIGGVATVVAGVAIALAVVLLFQVGDLRGEKDRLEEQLVAARQVVDQLRQIEAVRSAPDVRSVNLVGTAAAPEASGTYYWSKAMGYGALVCNNLKTLGPGETYQVWLFVDDQALSAGTFASWQGLGQWALDLEPLSIKGVDAVGVSIEPAGGSAAPSGEMILWGTLPED